jgi:hypothetical protein
MYLPLNKFLRRFNMIGLLKKLFGAKPAEQTAEVPYKVEVAEPAPVVTSVAEQATQAVVESVAKPAPKRAPAKKTTGSKPKAPRKPRAPKQPK